MTIMLIGGFFPSIPDGGWLEKVFRIKRVLSEQTDPGHYRSTGAEAAATPDTFLLAIVIYWRPNFHIC